MSGAGDAAESAQLRGLARMPSVRALIDLALDEDLGRGDVTTSTVVGNTGTLRARMAARESLVLAGIDVAVAVFALVDGRVRVLESVPDGTALERGDVAVVLEGPAAAILEAERTALNFVQRLSGVATLSRSFAAAVEGTGARVVDTRKTTPGYRALEKAAVRAGGCFNHRFDLGSGVLIKDNHIVACGGVRTAIERARHGAPHSFRIEVEVDSVEQLEEAIAARADVVLLDNMSVEQVRSAAATAHAAGLIVEVSGGITLDTVGDYARAGADIISSGAITHSARAVDLGLDA